MGIDFEFWGNKRVFVTGHTGFKGSWLSILLNYLGSTVWGYREDEKLGVKTPTAPVKHALR